MSDKLTPAQEIADTVCGSCGRVKPEGQPLCSKCFFTLPRDNRRFLYYQDADRLAAAYTAAKEWLAENRHWKGQRHAVR